ncbi:MAG: hypothetical protein M9921_07920 [Fimbriimonadaceae bacterium]|nr:hypothetical protein [Fimbriimonadaceae bacterium]
MAFLGGAVVGLLVTDPAAREPRPTQDVDVVVELATKREYDSLEERLRELGFQNVMEGPICRFRHGDHLLDVMPTSEEVLGFGNPWYSEALAEAVEMDLGEGVSGRVITAPYFLATKLAAFDSPHREGHRDLVASRDFEDVVTVVDGRQAVVYEVARSRPGLKAYLAERIRYLQGLRAFEEGVAAHLDIDEASQSRVAFVLERLGSIAGD